MGINPPNSTIDPIQVRSDNVWPATSIPLCKQEFRINIRGLSESFIDIENYVFPGAVVKPEAA